MPKSCDVIAILSIYGKCGAIRKPKFSPIFPNFLYPDINKVASLNKDLSKDITNESFLREKNVSVYQEIDE